MPWHTVLAMSAAFLLLAVMSWGFNFLYWHVWLWFGAFQVAALRVWKEQAAIRNFGESGLNFDRRPNPALHRICGMGKNL